MLRELDAEVFTVEPGVGDEGVSVERLLDCLFELVGVKSCVADTG